MGSQTLRATQRVSNGALLMRESISSVDSDALCR